MGQQAESIHDDACVLDTAILQAVDDHSPDANSRPVAGTPRNSPSMRTGPFEAAGRPLSRSAICSLMEKMYVGKAGTHGAKDVFQAVESGTLPRQWNLLNHVFPYILRLPIRCSPA